MLITHNYELIYNEAKGMHYLRIHDAELFCPFCGQILVYRDSRVRIWCHCDKPRDIILVHRMHCGNCDRLHTVLPDVLVPHKHYGADEIESVLESKERSDEVSDSTVARWRQWICGNKAQMEGALQSLKLKAEDEVPALRSTESLFSDLKDTAAHWLSTVTRLVVNGGYGFLPVSQCCQP